jgi:hypothetical protein
MESQEQRPDQELAEELEESTRDLEARRREVDGQLDEARKDWERKKQDDTVPGAQGDEGDSPAGA